MKLKGLIFYSLLVLGMFYSFHEMEAISKSVKKVLLNKTFFTDLQQDKDSVLDVEYERVKELFLKKKYVIGLKETLQLYDNSRKEGNERIEFLSAFLIGEIHRLNRNHEKSIPYYLKSLQILDLNRGELGDFKNFSDIDFAKNLLRLGSEYQYRGLNDSAIIYYEKLDQLNSLNESILGVVATSYSNLSGIYQQDTTYVDRFEKAIDYAERAIKIHKRKNDKIREARAINNLANVYLLQEDYEKSKTFYNQGLKLIEKDSSTRAIRLKASLYLNLAWAMRNLKDYEAYDKLETSYLYQDGLRDVETQEMLERVTGEYNVNTVRQEEEIKRKLAQRNTWILGISSFFIIVLLAFYLNQYKLRQKNLSLELSKQELMQQQKIEKIRSESQVRILNATIDGKEKERKQIAETLHDSVSALLSSANLHLQACKKQFNGSTPIEVDKSQSIINEASQKIRDLSHTLVSSILLKFGLSYAIKDIAEKYSNSQLHIDYETKYIQRYDQRFEIKLYNIIQEFVNNILKHSNATHASIVLVEKNKKLKLTIRDNGDGFDKEVIPEKDGLGINQIDARIQMMQGKFHIESGKGKGTLINIELPVFEKEPVKFV
ncbi:MAG: tetratricopeptide repeat protein [Flavobacteriaceae bacterium]